MNKKLLILLVVIVLALIFFRFYFPVISQYRDLKIHEEELTAEIDDLNTRLQQLIEERNLLLNDPVYLEKVIREELGLVKRGEVVYKFVEEEPSAKEDTEPQEPSQ